MAANPLATVREQLSGLYGRARDALEQRSQRERTLILVGGGFFVAFLIGLVAVLISSKLDELATHNQEVQEALRLVSKDGEAYRARRRAEQNLELSVSRPLPALVKYVDDIASKLEVKISESSERAAEPRGTKFQARSVDLKMREVDLPQLVRFLREVENPAHKIVVERLFVKPRYGQHDKMEVEMRVVGFEKADKKKGKGGREDRSRRSTSESGKGI